jgi:hypothetical protein
MSGMSGAGWGQLRDDTERDGSPWVNVAVNTEDRETATFTSLASGLEAADSVGGSEAGGGVVAWLGYAQVVVAAGLALGL